MANKVRITLTLSAKAAERLKAIQKILDSRSMAETIRLALGIADYVIEQVNEGNEICIKNGLDGSITELKLFI